MNWTYIWHVAAGVFFGQLGIGVLHVVLKALLKLLED